MKRGGYDVPSMLAPLRGVVEVVELAELPRGRRQLRLTLDCGHVRTVELVILRAADIARDRVACPVCLGASS